MLIENQLVEVTWSNRIKTFYINLGYKYTKKGDSFFVKLEHLKLDSNKYIKLICDYCGKEFPRIYSNYNKYKNNQLVDKDSCSNCRIIKEREQNIIKYGVEHYTKIKENGDKISERKRHSFNVVELAFKEMNYKLISSDKEYKNGHSKLKFICLKHEKHGLQKTTYASVRRGCGCYHCFLEKLTGENHHSWKGGLSPLTNFLRHYIENWKFESLKFYKFKCIFTGNTKDLVVHHVYPFHKIVQELLDSINLPLFENISKYSIEQLDTLKDLCLKLHYKYGYGVPMTERIHKLFHSLYGFNVNYENLEEFIKRYYNGEFKEVI